MCKYEGVRKDGKGDQAGSEGKQDHSNYVV